MEPIFFIKMLNIFNPVTLYNHHLITWSCKRNYLKKKKHHPTLNKTIFLVYLDEFYVLLIVFIFYLVKVKNRTRGLCSL